MKNITLLSIILAATLHFSSPSFARDIYVEENGLGGAYTNIEEAVNAASTTDRILVFPRANGNAYNILSDLTINCEMSCAVPGQRFILNLLKNDASTGGFDIMLNLTLSSNAKLINASIVYVLVTSHCQLPPRVSINLRTGAGMIGCMMKFDNLNLLTWDIHGSLNQRLTTITCNEDNVLENDTVFDQQSSGAYSLLLFHSGRICGNMFNGFSIRLHGESNVFSDTIFVVGNFFNYSNIDFNNQSHYVYFANNFVYTSTSVDNYISIGQSRSENGSDKTNAIINNTFTSEGIPPSKGIYFGTDSDIKYSIKNNLFVETNQGNGIPTHFLFDTPPSSKSEIKYNHFTNTQNFITGWSSPNETGNILHSNSSINSNGTLVAGSDAIDGGDPGANFLDLDLSRNDAGCFGGSFSMQNFNTPGIGGPRILFMNIPRSVFSTSPITISGDAVSK